MPNLGDIGEFGVISRLTAGHIHGPGVLLGPGDDAAVVAAPDRRVVISTDMLVQDRHFRLDWSAPADVGRKVVAQNAADIEAMGARVTAFVVAVAAPAHTPVEVLDGLNDGLWAEAERLDATIVGGDLAAARELVISATVLGDLDGREPVTIGGAHPGEVVAIRGNLGLSAAGYQLWQQDVEGFPALRRAHLVPAPPYGAGREAALGGASAMTDISDGLLADTGHIAAASAVHIDLHSASLEVYRAVVEPAATRLNVDPWTWLLAGGEDHALVATFSGAAPAEWLVIGEVRRGAAAVTVDGEPWLGAAGWDSFA